MKNAFATAMLCLGMFALAPGASAGDMNADNLKDCFKDQSSTKCSKNFDDVRKALEDITSGNKPTLALPVNPKSLPIGDLAKLLGD